MIAGEVPTCSHSRAILWIVLGTLAGLAPGCGSKGEVTVHGPEASDRAPREWVEAFTIAMDNNRPSFQRCYEDALKKDSSVQGTVTVRIELGAPSIPYAIGHTTGSDELAQCVIDACPYKIYLGSPPDGHLTFEVEFTPR